jgi:hypothetical protein
MVSDPIYFHLLYPIYYYIYAVTPFTFHLVLI